MKLYTQTVSKELLAVLTELMGIKELRGYRLVGGTSLALQFGHRKSVDIDLFAGGNENTENLPKILSTHFSSFELISKNRNGLMGLINNIKVDVLDWKVPFVEAPLLEKGLRLASAPDIFAFECDAILERKAEKDFVDIAMIATQHELYKLFAVLRQRYFYITGGSIAALLLKPDAIIRDYSIKYFEPYSFEFFKDSIAKKINDHENDLNNRKKSELETRDQKIQSVIEQKRKKQ
ncbi:MAG: nucleotidyl transferase AbiEii/AbiGii toxin family protein [Cyclobacteriaceae bacterium]|nr:nucleotidyl transferase AbiEii/AbiGii toxin family protein [Cyclobacteriaceae bacterium]